VKPRRKQLGGAAKRYLDVENKMQSVREFLDSLVKQEPKKSSAELNEIPVHPWWKQLFYTLFQW